MGHLVSLLCPESIPQFLRDAISQALRGEYLHVRRPGQDPAHEFLAAGRFQPHFDTAVATRSECLRRVPLPLGDVDRQLRLEQQSDLDRFLSAHDTILWPLKGFTYPSTPMERSSGKAGII